MQENITQKVRDDFDRIAPHSQERWDHNNHYHAYLLRQLPSCYKTVLDIGCGTGKFARLLAQHAEKVIGIDLSSNAIEVAKQRSMQFANIDFEVADISEWEMPNQYFDAIVSIATLHHLPIESLLPKLKSALKPNGKLVILDLVERDAWRDKLIDLIAVPLNLLYERVKNGQIEESLEAKAAMREHLKTDQYLTLSQAREIYTKVLGKVQIQQHLFWRYSVVWEKLHND